MPSPRVRLVAWQTPNAFAASTASGRCARRASGCSRGALLAPPTQRARHTVATHPPRRTADAKRFRRFRPLCLPGIWLYSRCHHSMSDVQRRAGRRRGNGLSATARMSPLVVNVRLCDSRHTSFRDVCTPIAVRAAPPCLNGGVFRRCTDSTTRQDFEGTRPAARQNRRCEKPLFAGQGPAPAFMGLRRAEFRPCMGRGAHIARRKFAHAN